jgi:hypothetical protein
MNGSSFFEFLSNFGMFLAIVIVGLIFYVTVERLADGRDADEKTED